MGPELPIACVLAVAGVAVWAWWRRVPPADEDDVADDLADVVLETVEQRAREWEEEAAAARRDVAELVAQLEDVERGIRTLPEVMALARRLPTEASV